MREIPHPCRHHEQSFSDSKVAIYRELRNALNESIELINNTSHTSEEAADISRDSYDTIRQGLPVCDALGFVALCTGQFESSLTSTTTARHKTTSEDLRLPRIPVGEYGESFAHRILSGAVQTVNTIESLYPELATIADRHTDVLRYHTFQGVTLKDPRASLVVTLQQGVIATGQELALLTAKQVPGFKQGKELAQYLSDNERITRLVRQIGSRVISTCVRYGCFIDPPLTLKGDYSQQLVEIAEYARNINRNDAEQARLALSEAAEHFFSATENSAQEALDNYELQHYKAFLGTSCPGAVRNGAVPQTAGLIMLNPNEISP